MNDYALRFNDTLRSLSGRYATIEALISVSEGNNYALNEYDFVYDALVDRGLVFSRSEIIQQEKASGIHDFAQLEFLTDYGRAFLAWYRQPHDTPQQMRLFGGDL